MPIRTVTYLNKQGEEKSVYHERTAPPDPRRDPDRQNEVTHAWEHPPDERATCEACQHGRLPAAVRK